MSHGNVASVHSRRSIEVMRKRTKTQRERARGVISLDDLVPRKDPKGGGGSSGKTVFGEGPTMTGANKRKAVEKSVRKER